MHGYCDFFSVTLEDLKLQADEFGLEGKDSMKFLKEEWWKIQDAKLGKERFEMAAEQKRLELEATEKRLQRERKTEEKLLLEREMGEKRLQREMEEKRLERELEAELQSEKLAARLELERLQLERAKMERENIEARAEVQSAASSQAGQENVAAVTKTPGLPGFVDGKDNLDTDLLRFERYAAIAGWQRDMWAVAY